MLFNTILDTGHFPQSWSNGIITPIHKAGPKEDPKNYRGIILREIPYYIQDCQTGQKKDNSFQSHNLALDQIEVHFYTEHTSGKITYRKVTLCMLHSFQKGVSQCGPFVTLGQIRQSRS